MMSLGGESTVFVRRPSHGRPRTAEAAAQRGGGGVWQPLAGAPKPNTGESPQGYRLRLTAMERKAVVATRMGTAAAVQAGGGGGGGASPAKPSDKCLMLVSGLSNWTTEATLRAHFSGCVEARLATYENGYSRGFAVLRFANAEAAVLALATGSRLLDGMAPRLEAAVDPIGGDDDDDGEGGKRMGRRMSGSAPSGAEAAAAAAAAAAAPASPDKQVGLGTGMVGRLVLRQLDFLGVHDVTADALALLLEMLSDFVQHALRDARERRTKLAAGGRSAAAAAAKLSLRIPELLPAVRTDGVCVGLVEGAWSALPPPDRKKGAKASASDPDDDPQSLERLHALGGVSAEQLPFRDFERKELVERLSLSLSLLESGGAGSGLKAIHNAHKLSKLAQGDGPAASFVAMQQQQRQRRLGEVERWGKLLKRREAREEAEAAKHKPGAGAAAAAAILASLGMSIKGGGEKEEEGAVVAAEVDPDEGMAEPPPMPDLDGGLRAHFLFVAPTKGETVARHSFVRGWLGAEAARLLPTEHVGTTEPAAPKGSPAERGTATLVLLSKLVLFKLYSLVRIAHELKGGGGAAAELALSRRRLAACTYEALPRPARAKGLPGASTFGKNGVNPMPHQVFVTDRLVGGKNPDAVIQRLKGVGGGGRRKSQLQRTRGPDGQGAITPEAAAVFLVAHFRGFLIRRKREKGGRHTGDDDDSNCPGSVSRGFGGPPINGTHGSSPLPSGGAYWRQRTQLAVLDTHAATSAWRGILRSNPTWC